MLQVLREKQGYAASFNSLCEQRPELQAIFNAMRLEAEGHSMVVEAASQQQTSRVAKEIDTKVKAKTASRAEKKSNRTIAKKK